MGMEWVVFEHHLGCRGAANQNHVRGKRDQFRHILACLSFIASTIADLDPHVAPRHPTQLPETFQKFRMANLSAGRVCAYPFQKADEANSLALLRA